MTIGERARVTGFGQLLVLCQFKTQLTSQTVSWAIAGRHTVQPNSVRMASLVSRSSCLMYQRSRDRLDIGPPFRYNQTVTEGPYPLPLPLPRLRLSSVSQTFFQLWTALFQ